MANTSIDTSGTQIQGPVVRRFGEIQFNRKPNAEPTSPTAAAFSS
jgi:hypothetical protein